MSSWRRLRLRNKRVLSVRFKFQGVDVQTNLIGRKAELTYDESEDPPYFEIVAAWQDTASTVRVALLHPDGTIWTGLLRELRIVK